METQFRIDIEKVLKEKAPNKKFPRFIKNYLKRITHQEEINRFLASVKDKKNLDFIESTIYNELEAQATIEGYENLPAPQGKNPYIFVSNHPLGGLDGLIVALTIGKHYEGKIKIISNDILMSLTPIKDLFIPTNKTGGQTREYLKLMNEFYESNNHLITFPAGACSRKINGKIQDLKWHKNFVTKAIEHQRDVVPIYFEGRNSNFFYNLSNIRKKLKLPNIEMLYLVNEMYKQRGNHFKVRIGKTIPYATFDKSKKPIEWANWVRERVYAME